MNIIPKKSLGQNFLVNEGVLRVIADAAELTNRDTVVEVGPGTGNLTRLLAQRAGTVIAIEKDRRLIAELQKEFAATNVKVVEGDVLDLDFETLKIQCKLEIENYKIVANLPYYITSHFLRTALEKWPRPRAIVLTIQKEVARRIMAAPPHMNPVRGKTPSASTGHARRAGRTSNGMSILALSVQYYAKPEIIMDVSRGSFRPMPNVDSAVIRLTPTGARRDQKLFDLIRAGFSSKRKKLANNIAGVLKIPKETILVALETSGIPATARAEMLSLAQWRTLVVTLKPLSNR